jgi:EAL domain-containing protein (putative c-di-GMP-specific phosphodiesterase class I)
MSFLHETFSRHPGIAQRLIFEIVESEGFENYDKVQEFIQEVKSLGCRISIDDFGTGYSSLAYLKRIPADIIKIDKSFVNGIHNDQDNLAIVRTILALGNSLEKRCLAEGIETAEHFEILKSLGCHFGQGYWMSKPIPATEFSDLLKEDKHYLHQNPLRALTA